MSIGSSESNKPVSIFSSNPQPLPMECLAVVDLSSTSSSSSISITSSYSDDAITIVTNFRDLRDIKTEIDFTTKNYIAEGSFGKMSIARLKNGSEVAIKEIKQIVYEKMYKKDVMLNKIWSEAANFIKVKGQPKFVELLGIYVNDINSPCLSMAIVMELADGDLEKYRSSIIRKKEVKLSYSNIRYLALEILSIIEACKQLKINYIDFHSPNILVFNSEKKLKLGDLDKIEPFDSSRSMIYQSLFELLKLSCRNHGKSSWELSYIKTDIIEDKEKFKSQLSEFLGGDDILCDIISEPLFEAKIGLKEKTDPLECMISQLQSCEIEPFPALKMV